MARVCFVNDIPDPMRLSVWSYWDETGNSAFFPWPDQFFGSLRVIGRGLLNGRLHLLAQRRWSLNLTRRGHLSFLELRSLRQHTGCRFRDALLMATLRQVSGNQIWR